MIYMNNYVDHDNKKKVEDSSVGGVQNEIIMNEGEEIPQKKTNKTVIAVYSFLILLGVGTGYLLSPLASNRGPVSKNAPLIQTDKTAGSSDSKTFKDSALGSIEKGGLDGEGTHNLIRDGGPSQTVYLISSVIDLDQYIGKKATVWGQTIAAEKAPWLMDVGKIEIE